MFGHQTQDNQQAVISDVSGPPVAAEAVVPAPPADDNTDTTTDSQPTVSNDGLDQEATSTEPTVSSDVTDDSSLVTPADDTSVTTPSTPADDTSVTTPSTPATFNDNSQWSDNHSIADDAPKADAVTAPAPSDELLDVKQQALQQLTPLMGHLDQTPEEKFRTTMMMIQAADNQALIPDAYAAAQQITDEKVKAQALLDVVNEINYFNHGQTK